MNVLNWQNKKKNLKKDLNRTKKIKKKLNKNYKEWKRYFNRLKKTLKKWRKKNSVFKKKQNGQLSLFMRRKLRKKPLWKSWNVMLKNKMSIKIESINRYIRMILMNKNWEIKKWSYKNSKKSVITLRKGWRIWKYRRNS